MTTFIRMNVDGLQLLSSDTIIQLEVRKARLGAEIDTFRGQIRTSVGQPIIVYEAEDSDVAIAFVDLLSHSIVAEEQAGGGIVDVDKILHLFQAQRARNAPEELEGTDKLSAERPE
jgi:hypothetical protein